MKLPYIKFYPRDWTSDAQLRMVSVGARGLWIELLCLMHQALRRGYLETAHGHPIDDVALSRLTGVTQDELERLKTELIDHGIPSICPESGIWYSRRILADESKRAKCSEAGRAGGGSPKLTPPHPPYNIIYNKNPEPRTHISLRVDPKVTFKGGAGGLIDKIEQDATMQDVIEIISNLRPEYSKVNRTVWESACKLTGVNNSMLVNAGNEFIQADANRHEPYSSPARYFGGILKRVMEDAGVQTETTAEKVERLRRSS